MKRNIFAYARVVALAVFALFATRPEVRAEAVDRDFSAWLAGVKAEAAQRGISAGILEQALGDLEPDPRVVVLDRRQPEFTQTFSRYLSRAVTDERIKDGQDMMRQHANLLTALEREYGVPARFLVAFWGLETNFGRVKGGFPVVGALATLSFDGRREAMFRRELFDALTILDRGDIDAKSMMGSWAGAMGHTQFMPSTFLAHAIDHDRDGRVDLWNSVPDALGSAANYLHHLGWNFGFTWGREVRLPTGFNIDLASVSASAKDTKLPLQNWSDLGVRRADSGALPVADITAALVVPEGAEGAAFLVYDNYNVILEWNRSVFYAIAVGHLADRLVGIGPLVAKPRTDEPLSRSEVMDLQNGLIALEHLTGAADGILGSGSRRAIKSFQAANGLVADGYADRELADAVMEKSGMEPIAGLAP